jgi:hypothetical protein
MRSSVQSALLAGKERDAMLETLLEANRYVKSSPTAKHPNRIRCWYCRKSWNTTGCLSQSQLEYLSAHANRHDSSRERARIEFDSSYTGSREYQEDMQ